MIRITLFWTALLAAFITSCGPTQKKTTEHENSLLKQAAYTYNFEFVERKNKIHSLQKKWLKPFLDSSLYHINKADLDPIATFSFQLDSIHSLDTLNNELKIVSSLLNAKMSSIYESDPGLIRSYFVSTDGWLITYPAVDTAIYPIEQQKLNRFLIDGLLDSTLIDYGAWYPTVLLDPVLNKWVRSYREVVSLNDHILGWIIVQADIKADIELLRSFGKDYMITDYEGTVIHADEDALNRLAMPKWLPSFTLSNAWEENYDYQYFSVYNSRVADARSAFNAILLDGSEKEEFVFKHKQVILLTADMSEIRCKLIKVIEQ